MKSISIIIPVYNAGELLKRCADSILNQTCDQAAIEVVLVDDGSTDESPALCDSLSAEHPDLFKVRHQANTGSPANPRNQGIEMATGQYVFFCDNDDYFGPRAMELMIQHASEWNPDVMLVKMGETCRKNYPCAMFKRSQPHADIYDPTYESVIRTLGPWKLFRKSLLDANHIRFPEDCSLDDSVFTLSAYLAADVVSVAADYEYYYWTKRADGGNLSEAGGSGKSAWRNPDDRLLGTKRMLELLDSKADPNRASNMYQKLFSSVTYTTLQYVAESDDSIYLDHARETLGPYNIRRIRETLYYWQAIPLNCLAADRDFTLFSETHRISKRGLTAFDFQDGFYSCKQSIAKSAKCDGCDWAIRCEKAYVVEHGEFADGRALTENETAWLRKTDEKERLYKSLWGRAALRISRAPFMVKALRPLKRMIFR